MALAVLFTICFQISVGALSTALGMGPLIAQTTQPEANQIHPSSQTSNTSQPPGTTQAAPQPAQSNSTTKKILAPSSVSHKKTHKKNRRKAANATTPHKVVVKNGGASDPSVQFSTPLSPEQASREKENTAGLLAATNANLQKLSGRQLNPSQQDTSAQVNSYMQQAKAAEAAGDLQSAHNLALKARILSDDLVKK